MAPQLGDHTVALPMLRTVVREHGPVAVVFDLITLLARKPSR